MKFSSTSNITVCLKGKNQRFFLIFFQKKSSQTGWLSFTQLNSARLSSTQLNSAQLSLTQLHSAWLSDVISNMMASSIDLCTSTLQTSIRPKAKRRSHSWPEADLCFLRQCTSGIFEPLPYQEEIELRSAMTSRNSNYSTSSSSTGSCIFYNFQNIILKVILANIKWFFLHK